MHHCPTRISARGTISGAASGRAVLDLQEHEHPAVVGGHELRRLARAVGQPHEDRRRLADEIERAGDDVALRIDHQAGGRARAQQQLLRPLHAADGLDADDARGDAADGGDHRPLFERFEVVVRPRADAAAHDQHGQRAAENRDSSSAAHGVGCFSSSDGSRTTSNKSSPRSTVRETRSSRSIKAISLRTALHVCVKRPPTRRIRSSGRRPTRAAARAGPHLVDKGRRPLEHVRHQHDAQPLESHRPLAFGGLLLRRGDELSRANRLHRSPQLVDRDGVVQPGVVQRVAQLLAEHRRQFAAPRQQRPARRAGIVAHQVEHVDGAVIRGLEDAAAGVQPRDDGNRPVLDADRLVARGHAEEVAQGQHAGALLDGDGAAEVEVRQPLGVDLQHGHVQPRVGAEQLRLEPPPVGERRGDVVGVQGVAEDGEDVARNGNEDAALVGFESAEPAGAVDLDHLRLGLVDRRRGGVFAGWRPPPPQGRRRGQRRRGSRN